MKKTILLVDDDESIVMVFKEILENLGYNVEIADNGKSALKLFKAKQKEIDLIICDVIMPLINGRDFYNKVKKINDETKFIFMSGYSSDLADEPYFNELKKDDIVFIDKPIDPKQLAEEIKKII